MLPLLCWASLALLCLRACGRLSGGPEFAEPMRNVSATQGENVALSCLVRRLGRNSVAWVKVRPGKLLAYDRKVFRDKHRYRLEVKTVPGAETRETQRWTLHISNVQPNDAGSYMCQINTHPMTAQTASLNLKVSPRIAQSGTSKDMEVREGANVTLHCAAEGSPPPVISWKRKDEGIIILGGPDGYGTSKVNGPSLSMAKVSRGHMTEYVCVARNGILPHESWTIKLHVTFPPTVLPLPEERVAASVGATATLACRAQAWPRPDFKWLRDGASIVASHNSRHNINVSAWAESGNSYETMSHLHIRDVGEADFGTYVCVATNELGSKSIPLQLVRDPLGRASQQPTVLQPIDFGTNHLPANDQQDALWEENGSGGSEGSAAGPPLPEDSDDEDFLPSSPLTPLASNRVPKTDWSGASEGTAGSPVASGGEVARRRESSGAEPVAPALLLCAAALGLAGLPRL